jgi:hypothetical protein
MPDYLEAQEEIAVALEEVYYSGLDDPRRQKPLNMEKIRVFRTICFHVTSQVCTEAETEIKSSISPAIQTILQTFKNPLLIIKKRDAKRLDFERVNNLKAKGDIVCFIY